MKKIVWILAVGLLFFSCANDSERTDSSIKVRQGEQRSKLSSGSENADELKAISEERQKQREEREKERLANVTSMEVSPSTFDFGRIPKEVPVSTIFTIKNTGDKPLIVSDTKASCGCTVPKKPEEPILPGEEHDLEVTFTSNPSQAGTTITKTITISANVDGGSQVVSIKGNVDE